MSRSIFGLTVWRPWAWCLAHPERFAVGKVCENRTYSAYGYARKYGLGLVRGDLIAIHAGLKFDDDGAAWIRSEFDTSLPPKPQHDTGIVAVATLAAVTRKVLEVYGSDGAAVRDPWAMPESWHWYLDAVIPLYTPVRCAGATGLWRLDEPTTRDVMSVVRRVEHERAQERAAAVGRAPWARVAVPAELATPARVTP